MQGGGLTDAKRAARERIRLDAVGRFESGAKSRETAAGLRVSERSVERWRRQWRDSGEEGVRSKGIRSFRRNKFRSWSGS
nr:helix-turn-helix domain-containing protein [Streptomyces liangshanensis]